MRALKTLRVLLALIVQPQFAGAQSGTWTEVPAPARMQTPLLLMDGSVFVHQYQSLNWWRLTPDASGDYVHGTWTLAATLPANANYNPLYYCSALLPDGRVVIMGGEYNWEPNPTTGVFSYVFREINKGAIYNPYTNVWMSLPSVQGWTSVGDMMCTVMPSTGRLMLARQGSTQLATLDPATLTWTVFTPTGKTPGDSNGEEGWTLLPDGTVLVVNANTGMASQRFIPNGPGAGTWVNAGTIPVALRDSTSHETGAQLLMYNGKLFAVGANRNLGANAIFTPPPATTPPSTALGSWEAAPSFPRKPYAVAPGTAVNCTGTAPNLLCQLDQADGPGVLMPNGRVLVNAGPGVFLNDTYWFEYDPTTNTLPEVARPPNSVNKVQFQYHMLLLPSGQVLAPDGSLTVQVYTPTGGPDPAWAPAITSVRGSLKPGNTYSLSGTQLNGLSEAVAYGDDYAAATNYPIVRMTNQATGHVFWARTHDRDNINIATDGTIITTSFDVPADLEPGTCTVVVIANGIPSAAVEVNHPPVTTSALAGPAGQNGWYQGDVQVSLGVTDPDGADDVAATYYTVDGGATQTYSGPFTVSGDAVHQIAFWSEDKAGDNETPRPQTIRIDATPPTLIFRALSPSPNAANWNTAPVDIAFTTDDNLSGVVSATPSSPLHFASEGGGLTQTITVTDEAGNSATFTSPAVNLDMTTPVVTAAVSATALWPPNHKMVPDVVAGRISDPLAGLDPGSATFQVIDEYGSVQPTGPVTVLSDGSYSFTLMLEASRLGGDADGRHYQIIVSVSDQGGNRTSVSAVVTVPHDQGR